ncbi:MAG: RNA ligase [Nitrospirota bacterium]
MGISTPSFMKKYFTDEEITKLQKKNALHTGQFNELILIRLTKDYKDYPRGTVFYKGGFIPGYPRIMRVLHLKNGINRYFKDRFYVEEKVDGYNVRIAMIDGNPFAFTRGGFICPFTTNRIPDLIDLNFFHKYPGYIINGEVVGPGSPYNTEVIPYIKEDVVFFSFDLFDEGGRNLSAEERYRTLEQFKIPHVRKWGPFSISDVDTVREVVLELDRDGREGIVAKPIPDGRPIKYVTLSSCLRDLQATANLITELPAGFYIQRILRAIFFCYEFGISLDDHYLLESAKALYLSPERVLKEVADGGNVRESFQIKIRNKNTTYELMEHLNRSGVSTKLLSVEKTDDYYSSKFHRIYTRGTREIRHRLMGHGFFD